MCEDESEAYDFWNKEFNHNPDDCCNLRRADGSTDTAEYCEQAKKKREEALNKPDAPSEVSIWD